MILVRRTVLATALATPVIVGSALLRAVSFAWGAEADPLHHTVFLLEVRAGRHDELVRSVRGPDGMQGRRCHEVHRFRHVRYCRWNPGCGGA